MKKVYVLSAKRTPIGSFGGRLNSFSATQLGSKAIQAAIVQSDVDKTWISEVFFGNVCSANLGQAPARQAALGAGMPNTIPCTTVNKVCSSGMKSIMFGAQSIMLGHSEIVVAGGMESMSNIPYYIPKLRWGTKYGGSEVVDGLQRDGLTDAYDHQAMGNSGDATATKYGFSRSDQDDYAVESYKKAKDATEEGSFNNEIVPIEIPQRKGDPFVMLEDEEFRNVQFEKIPNLRPAFSKNGTVTAANASTLNDGAAALVLASEDAVEKYGLQIIAEVVSFGDAAHEPTWFTTAPTKAAPLAIGRANMQKEDIDFFEVNEAFSSVPMAFAKELNIKIDRINVNGGAVALGHPLGCSGARIVTTLIHVLEQKDAETGCATLCNGGGGASALVIKRI